MALTLKDHKLSLVRSTPGAYSAITHKFVPGITATCDIYVNAQPVNPKEMLHLPEGQRVKSRLRLFGTDELKTSDINAHTKADRVVWCGKTYEIESVTDWSETDLPHYESVAVLLNENEALRSP